MKTAVVFIYALLDPVSSQVRYIGKSINPKKRLNKHLHYAKNNTKSHKDAWLNGLLKRGLQPFIKILQVTTADKWRDVEKSLIKSHRKTKSLLNMMPGGEGVPSGHIPWNKGLKGVCKANSGSFQPGEHRSCATEFKKNEHFSPETEWKSGQVAPNRICISQYDLSGNFIKDYPSYKTAARSIGVTYIAIRNCIKVTKTNKCRGYLWKIK
jgi:hypothetical protein